MRYTQGTVHNMPRWNRSQPHYFLTPYLLVYLFKRIAELMCSIRAEWVVKRVIETAFAEWVVKHRKRKNSFSSEQRVMKASEGCSSFLMQHKQMYSILQLSIMFPVSCCQFTEWTDIQDLAPEWVATSWRIEYLSCASWLRSWSWSRKSQDYIQKEHDLIHKNTRITVITTNCIVLSYNTVTLSTLRIDAVFQ